LINLLCDQSLVFCFSEDKARVSLKAVAQVAIDRNSFGLSAFCNVPQKLVVKELREEIAAALKEIRRGEIPEAEAT
jgi:hypothetical protein